MKTLEPKYKKHTILSNGEVVVKVNGGWIEAERGVPELVIEYELQNGVDGTTRTITESQLLRENVREI